MTRRIVGIDPGFASLGWAVAELLTTGPRLVSVGCVRTAPGRDSVLKTTDNLARLRILWRGLQSLAELRPVALACEAQSWPRNAGAATKVGMTWGLVAALAESLAIPVIHIAPQALKLAVAGNRSASKGEVAAGVALRPGFELLGGLLDSSRLPAGQWEHPTDAAAAIVAALDTELGRAVKGTP